MVCGYCDDERRKGSTVKTCTCKWAELYRKKGCTGGVAKNSKEFLERAPLPAPPRMDLSRQFSELSVAPRHNIRELYHGTSLEAALAIQREGFRIDLSGTNAGAMLGDGVYCTTTLEKALNYAKPNLHGGAIFRMQVDLGRCYTVSHYDPMMKTWHKHGYDSAWSADGVNGLREENCVRNHRRCKIQNVILPNTGKAKAAGYTVVPTAGGDKLKRT